MDASHELQVGKSGGYSAHFYPEGTLSLDELACWVAFLRVSGIGPIRFRRLLTFFQGKMQEAWKASATALVELGIDQKTIHHFQQLRATHSPLSELERMQKTRMKVLTVLDDQYPPLLKQIENAPPVLFYCGDLHADDRKYAIGIVGTRKMTTYGSQVTEQLARDFAEGRMTVVSGLAAGVDTVAHHTALDHQGRTLAVLPSGLDLIYPAQNAPLARRIAESGRGALITTYPLGVKADPRSFPARNVIISGLSLGVIVTEAPQKSGAILTAQAASEQGREVFAVPGSIFSPSSQGCHHLIRQGAIAVTCAQEVVSKLNLFLVPAQPERPSPRLKAQTGSEHLLLSLLSHKPQHIDELVASSRLTSAEVGAAILSLTMKGAVVEVGNMHYVLT